MGRPRFGIAPAVIVGIAALALGFGPRLLNAAIPAEHAIASGTVLHAGVGFEYTPDPAWQQLRGLTGIEDQFAQASRLTDGTVTLDARATAGSSLPEAYQDAADRLAERHRGARAGAATPFTNSAGLAGLRGEVTGADRGVLAVYVAGERAVSVTALGPSGAGLGQAAGAVDAMIDSVREAP